MDIDDKQEDVSPPIEPPSKFAIERAAQLWCEPTTEKIAMIPELCIEIAKVIDQYREALMWCGGSIDFAPNGKASEGWNKICQPLIKTQRISRYVVEWLKIAKCWSVQSKGGHL